MGNPSDLPFLFSVIKLDYCVKPNFVRSWNENLEFELYWPSPGDADGCSSVPETMAQLSDVECRGTLITSFSLSVCLTDHL